jgi:hypothetical protein
MQIAIVLYPGLTALDAVGPYEILRPLPDAEVRFGAAAGAALVITPALGTYLVAAGLLDHAAWDASGVSSLVHADVASSTWWSSRRAVNGRPVGRPRRGHPTLRSSRSPGRHQRPPHPEMVNSVQDTVAAS